MNLSLEEEMIILGNDISANSSEAIVEDGLFTRFTTLTIANDGLPKVRYRYDISGHVLSTSKQIDGNILDIDLSRNIPNTDVSANWLPTSQISNANSWNNLHNRTAGEVYPEHRYQFKSYSMRYSLDPNYGTDASLNDLSWNNYQAYIWETPRPQRSEVTQSSTYLNEMSATTDNTPWLRTLLPVGHRLNILGLQFRHFHRQKHKKLIYYFK